MNIFEFCSNNTACSPDNCERFGDTSETKCYITEEFDDDELIRLFGLESMKMRLEPADYAQRKLIQLLEK